MGLYDDAIKEVADIHIRAIQEFLKDHFDLEPPEHIIRQEFEQFFNAVEPAMAQSLQQNLLAKYGKTRYDHEVALKLGRITRDAAAQG